MSDIDSRTLLSCSTPGDTNYAVQLVSPLRWTFPVPDLHEFPSLETLEWVASPRFLYCSKGKSARKVILKTIQLKQ